MIKGNIWLNNLDIFTHRKPQQAAVRREKRDLERLIQREIYREHLPLLCPRGALKTSPIEDEINERAHLSSPQKAHENAEAVREMPQVGGEEEKRGRGSLSRQERSTYQSVPMSCFISLWRVFLIHVLSFPRSLPFSLSFPITRKGCCHLLSPPSLTRREHIKVGLKPREARDQSRPLISLGRRRIDGYARLGGGGGGSGGGGGHTLDRVPVQSSKMWEREA